MPRTARSLPRIHRISSDAHVTWTPSPATSTAAATIPYACTARAAWEVGADRTAVDRRGRAAPRRDDLVAGSSA